MRIQFDHAVPLSQDLQATAVTVDHIVIYPQKQIILNMKDGGSKIFGVDDLSNQGQKAFTAFITSLSIDIKSDYEKAP